MQNDVDIVIRTVIMARSIVKCGVLSLCVGIVEVEIPIQASGTKEEKVGGVTPVRVNEVIYRVLSCTQRVVHEDGK
jgi:hypothetical protein